MLVEMGNPAPTRTENAPVVTYFNIPNEYGYQAHESADVLAGKLARHLATATAVTRLGDVSDGTGDHEAFLAVTNGWRAEANAAPTWVWSDNEDFATLLGAFYDCPVGRPDDVEDTHYTSTGGEPGQHPEDHIPDVPAVDPFPAPEAAPEPEATE